MRSVIIVFFLLISGCTWLDGVRYGIYPADDQERYEMGIDNGPVLYSYLGPKGDWAVRSDYRRIRANISFQANPYDGIVYHLRTKMANVQPKAEQETWVFPLLRKRVDLFLEGDYEKHFDINYTEKYLKHLTRDQKRKDIYYKVSGLGGLKCAEYGDYRHFGPSPDPVKGGQWAGMGAYERTLDFFCPLRKFDGDPNIRWFLTINTSYIIGHSSKMQDTDGNQLTLEDIDRDFKERIFWALDSLELYGFDQKPYESE